MAKDSIQVWMQQGTSILIVEPLDVPRLVLSINLIHFDDASRHAIQAAG